MRLWGTSLRVLALAIAASGPADAQRPQLRPDSRPECAVCHLQWTEGFTLPDSVLLIERPPDAVVAESATCLGCHDGSVADSRRSVWLEHGHQEGIEPPPTMRVPELLPLKDGRIACRTCHTAHSGVSADTLAATVSLRARNEAGQLCQMCHAEHARPAERGWHPLGALPWPVPAELVAAGAKVGPEASGLTCQACHTPHGAREDQLLVMAGDSSRLCLSCHSKLGPELWGPDQTADHPRNPPLSTDAQRQAIKELGTRTGAGGTLSCLSCHKVHGGHGGRDLLADGLEDSALCLRCHRQLERTLGSKHDLRLSAPQERDRLGRTAADGGPCSACHSVHQQARQREPSEVDPAGSCATCHQPGQCAARTPSLTLSHPAEVDCLTCHDPHETQHARFLRQEPNAVCAECHDEKAESLAGAHDFTNHADAKNGRGRTAGETGKCGFCHGVHNANGPVLWVATAATPESPDDFCIQCHRPGGLAAEKPVTRFRHPTGPDTAGGAKSADNDLPLFNSEGRWAKDGFVACGTCHDPHADPQASPHLLRIGPPTSALCVTCHSEKALLAKGSHDSTIAGQRWPDEARKNNDMCLACHQPHSNDPARELWTVTPAEADEPADGTCLGCHPYARWSDEATGAEHGAALHPEIGCTICHNPHAGPAGAPPLLRAEDPANPAALCADCHESVETLAASMHGSRALGAYAAGVCGPCHAVHAKEGSTSEFLWAGPRAAGDVPPGTERCLGCHGPGGRANQVKAFDHPAVFLQNLAAEEMPGFLPLVAPGGERGARGRIFCVTCHLPHGRAPEGGFPEVDPASVAVERLRLMGPMLRPYVAPNLCGTCHGYDGLRRFLYFHDRDKLRPAPAGP